MKLLRLWFGLSLPVSRRDYLLSGVALMALKVLADNAVAFAATGKPWPFAAYVLPSLALKSEALGPNPGWALAAWALLALPFMWVGMSMTVRRAADAGASPWLGVLFFIPFVNYVVMLVFAALPSAKREGRWKPVAMGPFRSPGAEAAPPSVGPVPSGLKSAMLGVASSVGIGLGMIGASVYSMKLYGAALFFGTPFVMGLVTAMLYNRNYRRGLGATLGLAAAGVGVTGLATLLFAIEGILCLVMAAPIALVIATLGAALGWALSFQSPRSAAASMVLALPALAGVESKAAAPQLREVTTSIEIDAPPEAVWRNVIGFSELPPPPEWFFRLGIAYPVRARIQGEGVGAVRHCEFSTGPFVEPITTWDPPRRLAFDVVAQPPSMTELSPYRHVQAPHLEGYMVSRGGEFRLVPLGGGRTRLEGSTFYTLSIFPEAYWVVFGEGLLHAIHGRVLRHIKHLSETPS